MFRMTAIAGRVAGAAVAAVFAAALATPAAHAAAPHAASPGDNGDVKIHAVGTSFVDQRNEPHVCQFYLDAFNFDPNTNVSWEIDQQPPTGNAAVLSGTLMLKSDGSGVSSDYTLPAGHYKLTWTFAGEKGSAKHKTFWSDCAGVASPPPGSTVVSSGGTVVGTVTTPGMVQTPSGHEVPLHQALSGKTLPQTGAGEVVPMAAVAAGLALTGVVLVRRTRRVGAR
ncbi:MAG: LPXTG cell wall anchor domain-containing protein [Catenulispora sp.]|nr:LPXTG cell wall anchor domain-containing protein [Catenulispora sp.]